MYFRGAAPAALTFLSVALSFQKVGHPWSIQYDLLHEIKHGINANLKGNRQREPRVSTKIYFFEGIDLLMAFIHFLKIIV